MGVRREGVQGSTCPPPPRILSEKCEKALRGSGGMLPRKFIEILHTVVAVLILFEQLLGKFCLNFFPLNLRFSPNMMHFVCTFSTMRA